MSTSDNLPGEGPIRRRDYLDVVAEHFGLTVEDLEEMDAERDAYEAEFPPVDAADIPAGDTWGLASEWAQAEGGCVACGELGFDDSLGLCGECAGADLEVA